MKAIAVIPGQPNSIHLRDVRKPSISGAENGREILVRMLQVGVDGTDKGINAAEYGQAPAGDDYLIIGHESFGVVEEIGPGADRTRSTREDISILIPAAGKGETRRKCAGICNPSMVTLAGRS
jgi:threonine dehydrogenase-like Zn-dependent dehydrogenase